MFSRHNAPELCATSALHLKRRAQGKPVHAAPAVSCALRRRNEIAPDISSAGLQSRRPSRCYDVLGGQSGRSI